MASYSSGGDYDAGLLKSAPQVTKNAKQGGYNIDILASDSSETPMNAGNQSTAVDEHTSAEAVTPPNKEAYTSYPVQWYRQGKWRIVMLIVGIIIIGAIVGGVVGGTVGKNKKNTVHGPSTTLSIGSPTSVDAAPAQSQGQNGPGLSTVSTTGSAASAGNTGRPPQVGGDGANLVVDTGEVPSVGAALVG